MTPYSLAFRNTPAVLRRIASLVPPDRARLPLADDRFSLVEMAGHLADSETIFLDRIRGAAERDVPTFERIDVDERAREMRFSEGSLAAQLELFAARRAGTIAFLEGLAPAAWAREFTAPMGRVSIERFVAFLAGHDHYHLEQASAYLEIER